MEYVRIGHVINTFGLKGEMKVFVMTDFRTQRFHSKKKLTLFNEDTGDRVEITSKGYRDQGQIILFSAEEITSIEQAEKYKGYFVEIDKADAPLPKGMVRLEDLKGCKVFDTKGTLLGEVKDVQTYAPTPNLKVLSLQNKFFYVPFIDVFVKEKNIEEKKLVIDPIEGML